MAVGEWDTNLRAPEETITFEQYCERLNKEYLQEDYGWVDEVRPDPVDPSHYKAGEIECIDYIEQQLGPRGLTDYCIGNAHKYIHRWRFKNGVEDLRKAVWYLNKVIENES